jgi:hypothetical protein
MAANFIKRGVRALDIVLCCIALPLNTAIRYQNAREKAYFTLSESRETASHGSEW